MAERERSGWRVAVAAAAITVLMLGVGFALRHSLGAAADVADLASVVPLAAGLIRWSQIRHGSHEPADSSQAALAGLLRTIADARGLTGGDLRAGLPDWDDDAVDAFLNGTQLPPWTFVTSFLNLIAGEDRWLQEVLERRVRPAWDAARTSRPDRGAVAPGAVAVTPAAAVPQREASVVTELMGDADQRAGAAILRQVDRMLHSEAIALDDLRDNLTSASAPALPRRSARVTTARRHRPAFVAAAAGLAAIGVSAAIDVTLTPGTAPRDHRTGDAAGPGPAGTRAGNLLSALALGVVVAPWDGIYAASTSASSGNTIQPLLRAADIGLIGYGGSSSAFYDWQTNSDISGCLHRGIAASFAVTAGCTTQGALDFSGFSTLTRAAGAQSFVSVNYGSGTPAEAASWVARSQRTSGEHVARWEIGSETYGCWEPDDELAGPPEDYRGYIPAASRTCPQTTQGNARGTQTLATSYAVNALAFMLAMKKAEPSAQLGVPWAFDSAVPGAQVADNAEWNTTVLRKDGRYISFVDAHYYPFSFSGSTGGSNPTDQQVLQSLMSVPSLYREIRSELDTYVPSAQVLVGATNVSNVKTTVVCHPVGALFAAGDVLSWLAAGAVSVDWWDMNSYGNTGATCTNADDGMFTSDSPPAPETPYYGYRLASVLAQPHALLAAMPTSDPADILAFQSLLPGGKEAVGFINTNTSSAETVTFHPSEPLSGQLHTWTYGEGNQNATSPDIIQGARRASSPIQAITLPAESMEILESR